MQTQNTIEVGATSEERAVDHLLRQGYRIVERNFRCKVGELDVIARDGRTLVFVEVRSRRSAEYGSALEAVHWGKRKKVSRVAQAYLTVRRPHFETARFDVIAITGGELVHIQDAWRL